jgi:hypothetical protein
MAGISFTASAVSTVEYAAGGLHQPEDFARLAGEYSRA